MQIIGNKELCEARFHIGDKGTRRIVLNGKLYSDDDGTPWKGEGVVIRIQHLDKNCIHHFPVADFDPTGPGNLGLMNPNFFRIIETVDGRMPIDVSIPQGDYDISYELANPTEKLNCQLPDGSIVPMTKAEYDVALASYLNGK